VIAYAPKEPIHATVPSHLRVCDSRGRGVRRACRSADADSADCRSHPSQRPDQAKGVEWYQKYFGGQPMTEAPDRLMFGDTRLIFLRNEKGQPSTGSALDHIGLSVADLDAKVKELEAAASKSSRPCGGARTVQDGLRRGSVGHAHRGRAGFREARAPSRAPARARHCRDARLVQGQFGGDTAKMKDRLDGLKYSGVWLLVQRGDATPSEGHAIDHIGWRTPNLDAKTKELKART